jgi:hypothetical protein
VSWAAIHNTNLSTRFIFDGERVNDDDTPDSMDMSEGDSLEVVLERALDLIFLRG